MGAGSQELGEMLLRSFLNNLAALEELPKALSSECGMCLQLPVEKYALALAVLQQEGPLPFQK